MGSLITVSTFEGKMRNFKLRLKNRLCPENTVGLHLFEVNFTKRERIKITMHVVRYCLLSHNATQHKRSALPNLKNVLMEKWHFIVQNQQRLRQIFKEPPLLSHRKGKSLTGV